MSGDINRVILVGRLGQDAELTYTTSGTPLTKFSIAVNERVKHGDQWGDKTHWFDITLWGKRGESLNQYLRKGQQVAIEGSLDHQTWVDRNTNQNRSKIAIKCTEIQLVGGSNNSGQGNYNNGPQRNNQGGYNNGRQQNSGYQNQGYNQNNGQGHNQPDQFEDDIPF